MNRTALTVLSFLVLPVLGFADVAMQSGPNAAPAAQTQFNCNIVLLENYKQLDQKSYTYILGENAGWGATIRIGQPGQTAGFEVILSNDNDSSHLFIAALSGQILPNGFSYDGSSAHAEGGLPLNQILHLDMSQKAIKLIVNCTPID